MSENTAVTTFEGVQLPAYMQDAINSGDIEKNLQARLNVNQLTFRGKVWRAIVEGDEHIQSNEDGDPVSTIKVVILGQNPARSRAYYEGAYKEGENRMPTCFSIDGVLPDAEVKEPCGTSCAACPMAAKGSRVNQDNTPGVACATFKNLAVIPANALTFPALRLRLPQTSIWDKDTDGETWMAFDQYMNKLRNGGIPNTALVVTKIKFDSAKAYPKLLFALDVEHDEKLKALVTQKEFATISTRLKEDFSKLIGTKSAVAHTLSPVAVLDAEKPKVIEAKKPKAEKADKPAPVAEAEVEVAAKESTTGLGKLLDDWDDA